jgi:hypothetical protein
MGGTGRSSPPRQDFDERGGVPPGDDPKDIDWKTSVPRAGHPVIKRFQKETNLSMVLA